MICSNKKFSFISYVILTWQWKLIVQRELLIHHKDNLCQRHSHTLIDSRTRQSIPLMYESVNYQEKQKEVNAVWKVISHKERHSWEVNHLT